MLELAIDSRSALAATMSDRVSTGRREVQRYAEIAAALASGSDA